MSKSIPRRQVWQDVYYMVKDRSIDLKAESGVKKDPGLRRSASAERKARIESAKREERAKLHAEKQAENEKKAKMAAKEENKKAKMAAKEKRKAGKESKAIASNEDLKKTYAEQSLPAFATTQYKPPTGEEDENNYHTGLAGCYSCCGPKCTWSCIGIVAVLLVCCAYVSDGSCCSYCYWPF